VLTEADPGAQICGQELSWAWHQLNLSVLLTAPELKPAVAVAGIDCDTVLD